MANWGALKTAIESIIRPNDNQEITGQLLQNVLNSIVSNVGQNATFKGFATPETVPGIPDGPCFYLACETGTYTNFGGASVKRNSLCVLSFTDGAWSKLPVFYPHGFGTYFLAKGGESCLSITGRTISISGVRRINHGGSWDESAHVYSFDMFGAFDYILVRKSGTLVGNVGELEFKKGTLPYFWNEPEESEYDVFLYSDTGFWKSQIPEVQILLDKYYNPVLSSSEKLYDMGVLFDGASAFGNIKRAFFNRQEVQKDGFLSGVKIKASFVGDVYLIVLRSGVTEGKWLSEVSRTRLSLNGLTEISGLRIPVKYGDYIAIAGVTGETINGKLESTGIGENFTDINEDFNNTFYVTTEMGPINDITFQYQYTVTSFKTIGATEYINTDIVKYNEYIEPNASFKFTGWITNVDSILNDGVIHRLKIKVGGAAAYTFAVGILDQWNKAVIRNTYSLNLAEGLNDVAVNFSVRAGDHLFMRMNGDGVNEGTVQYFHSYGSGVGTNFLISTTVEDPLYYLGDINYGGGLPLTFWVKNKESVFAFKEDLETVNTNIVALQNVVNSGKVTLKAPSGNEFQIVVSDTGVLSTISLTVNKWLALGNSITRHYITSFWWGDWGMAASTRDKDWVHVLQNKIALRYNNTPSFDARSIAAWESAPDTYDKTLFDSMFAGDEDLVVLRLGENVSYNSNYEANFDGLIKYVKSKAPLARVIVTGNFWASTEKDIAQKNACEANGCVWVKLSQLDTAANRSSLDAQVYGDDLQWHTISDGGSIAPGVAYHPGDLGMANIAEAIYSVL